MNYFRQLNGFWNWRRLNELSHSQADLYFAALHIANSLGGEREFSLPNSTLMGMCQISRVELNRQRLALVEKGLIEFSCGRKGSGGRYAIVPLYDTNFDTNSVTKNDTKNGFLHYNNINKNNKENKIKNNPKEKGSPGDDFGGRSFSAEIGESVSGWLRYKAERGEDYTPTGLESLLSQIERRLAEMSEKQVVSAVSESMACNYKGIVWDKAASFKAISSGRPSKEVGAHRYNQRDYDDGDLEKLALDLTAMEELDYE